MELGTHKQQAELGAILHPAEPETPSRRSQSSFLGTLEHKLQSLVSTHDCPINLHMSIQ